MGSSNKKASAATEASAKQETLHGNYVPSADLIQEAIDGTRCAETFLKNLRISCPTGDEMYSIISQRTPNLSQESEAYLRGFLRAIQKNMEQKIRGGS
jgi:hypothetical protein